MSWHATLVDGPLEGQTLPVEEETSNDPPATVQVDGHRYLYCGFANNAPRYRYDGDED